jgi:hypothetical protein
MTNSILLNGGYLANVPERPELILLDLIFSFWSQHRTSKSEKPEAQINPLDRLGPVRVRASGKMQ